jgi:hypothetical protein
MNQKKDGMVLRYYYEPIAVVDYTIEHNLSGTAERYDTLVLVNNTAVYVSLSCSPDRDR